MGHWRPRRPTGVKLLDALLDQPPTFVAVATDNVQLVAHDEQPAPEAPHTQCGARDPEPQHRVQHLHRRVAFAVLVVGDPASHPELSLKRNTRVRGPPHPQPAVQLRPHHVPTGKPLRRSIVPLPCLPRHVHHVHDKHRVGTRTAVPVVTPRDVHLAVEHGTDNGGQLPWQRRARRPPVGDRVEAFDGAVRRVVNPAKHVHETAVPQNLKKHLADHVGLGQLRPPVAHHVVTVHTPRLRVATHQHNVRRREDVQRTQKDQGRVRCQGVFHSVSVSNHVAHPRVTPTELRHDCDRHVGCLALETFRHQTRRQACGTRRQKRQQIAQHVVGQR